MIQTDAAGKVTGVGAKKIEPMDMFHGIVFPGINLTPEIREGLQTLISTAEAQEKD